MKGCCPRCGFSAGMEAFVSDAEWKIAVAAAGALPSDCGPLVIRYIGCFAPQKRGLNSNRAAKLIGELRDMIIDGITFDRKEINAPSYVWAQAIQAVLDSPTLRLPLKDHHYLLRIVESKLVQRTDIDQAERHQSRRGDARMNSDRMQPIGDAIQTEDKVSIAFKNMSKDDQQKLMDEAIRQLQSEKFSLAHQQIFAMPRAMEILRKRLGLEVDDAGN